jgi:phenylacetaldehyde dehydrogenase
VVHDKIHDEVVEKVAAFADGTTVGPGWSRDSRMGPVIDQDQFDRVSSYVDIAKNEGAELVAGGSPVDGYDTGYFFKPTVFDRVDVGMRIAQEEVFGPVLAIQTYHDEDEAVAVANSVEFGLASSIWTNDLGRAHRVARRIRAGTVWVNTYGEFDDAMSFGGYKQSGFGRELGKHAVEAYTQVKSVWVAV